MMKIISLLKTTLAQINLKKAAQQTKGAAPCDWLRCAEDSRPLVENEDAPVQGIVNKQHTLIIIKPLLIYIY